MNAPIFWVIGFFRSMDFVSQRLLESFRESFKSVQFVVCIDSDIDEELHSVSDLLVISKTKLIRYISEQFDVPDLTLHHAAEAYKPLYKVYLSLYAHKALSIDYAILTDDDIFLFEKPQELIDIAAAHKPFLIPETMSNDRIEAFNSFLKHGFKKCPRYIPPQKGGGYNIGLCGIPLSVFNGFNRNRILTLLELFESIDVWWKEQAFWVSLVFGFFPEVHTFSNERYLFLPFDHPFYPMRSKVYHCINTDNKSPVLYLHCRYPRSTNRHYLYLEFCLRNMVRWALLFPSRTRRFLRRAIIKFIEVGFDKKYPNANRYNSVLEYIAKHKCKRILEIGVWRGDTSVLLLKRSLNSNVEYHGVDLFETTNDSIIQQEVSLRANSLESVLRRLRRISKYVHLHKGFSSSMFPKFRDMGIQFDMIWIDGGHSYQTVRSDLYNCASLLSPSGQIFMDDYTSDPHLPDVKRFVDDELSKDTNFETSILDRWVDTYRGYNYKTVSVRIRSRQPASGYITTQSSPD
jgi:hypothetical protein